MFDRTFRAECAQHRDYPDSVPTLLAALRNVITDIVEQAHGEGTLAHGIDTDSATTAILTVIRGLSEYPTMAPQSDYQTTVRALKALLAGTLVEYRNTES